MLAVVVVALGALALRGQQDLPHQEAQAVAVMAVFRQHPELLEPQILAVVVAATDHREMVVS